MEILHEAKQPRPWISTCLSESFHRTDRLSRVADAIALHTCMCEFAFCRVEPGCCEGCVGKEEEPENGYEGSHCSFAGEDVSIVCIEWLEFGGYSVIWADLHDEKPSPSRDSVEAVHTCEDAGGNQAREARGKNLSAVKESDAGRDLCFRNFRL